MKKILFLCLFAGLSRTLLGQCSDCTAPTVVCLNGLSANLMPSGMIQLWASDLLQYVQDNVSPVSQIKIGLRRSGTGTGFPVDTNGNPIESLKFTCADLGTQSVELWAIDEAGNANYCETYLIVADNLNACSTDSVGLIVCTRNEQNQPIFGVGYYLTGTGNAIPNFTYTLSPDSVGPDGCTFLTFLPPYYNAVISPFKDDSPKKGVNTLDLILIGRHLLGIQPLGSPYKMIAADANKSGTITSFDIVELRKLILGIYTELPNNTSWRFVDANYMFPNPNNPFAFTIPENQSFTNLFSIQYDTTLNFIGIKIGDVNGSAGTSNTPGTDVLTLPDQMVSAGSTIDVPIGVSTAVDWYGLQFALKWNLDQLQLSGVMPDNQTMTVSNFAAYSDHLSVSWEDISQHHFNPGQTLFRMRMHVLKSVHLCDAIKLNPDLVTPESYPDLSTPENHLVLQCGLPYTPPTPAPGFPPVLFDATPNPTAGGATIGVRLYQEGEIRLVLTDISGRTVYTFKTMADPGDQSLAIPAEAMSQNGVYFWTTDIDGVRQTGKLVRLK
jgi:hypothetical protein